MRLAPFIIAGLALTASASAGELIPVPQFRTVELRGGGSVTIVPGPVQRVTIIEGSSQFTQMGVEQDGKLRIQTCNQRCPPVYRMRVEIQSPNVPNVGVSGGGAIAIEGGFRPQSQLSAAVNGGGHIDARAIQADSVSAAVNGGGQILVRPRGNLAAAVNGGGLIRYWGNPRLMTAIHGGGAVTPGN